MQRVENGLSSFYWSNVKVDGDSVYVRYDHAYITMKERGSPEDPGYDYF